jgi:hypothetical protein
MFDQHIENVVYSPVFMSKIASMFPRAMRVPLQSTLGMSGDPDTDIANVVAGIGKTAYIQRRERSLINTGLQSLKEIENGH